MIYDILSIEEKDKIASFINSAEVTGYIDEEISLLLKKLLATCVHYEHLYGELFQSMLASNKFIEERSKED